MGSLTSRPKAKSSPQVVYVPAPTPATVPTPTISQPSRPTAEQAAQTQREDNLLRRDRGKSGTIQTGFRGILNAVENAAQKKTLLGE